MGFSRDGQNTRGIQGSESSTGDRLHRYDSLYIIKTRIDEVMPRLTFRLGDQQPRQPQNKEEQFEC